MAERSGGGPADRGPCRRCDQTIETKVPGDVCAKCKSQHTEESASTHPAAGASDQRQAEAGQRGRDQVTSSTGGNETLQVPSKGRVNTGQEKQAEGRDEAGELATGSDVQDKRQGSGQDLNERRKDVQPVGPNDKSEVDQKSMVDQPKTSAIAHPVVMLNASGKVVPSTCNPRQEGMKQGNIATSTDSKPSGENGAAHVLAEKSNSTKTVSCRVQCWSIHEQLCTRKISTPTISVYVRRVSSNRDSQLFASLLLVLGNCLPEYYTRNYESI